MDHTALVLLALEKVEKKLEHLTEDIRKQGMKLDTIEKSRARRNRIFTSMFLAALAASVWWVLGDRITSTVSNVYRGLEVALMAKIKSSPTVIQAPTQSRR
jgi:hypothetical protein